MPNEAHSLLVGYMTNDVGGDGHQIVPGCQSSANRDLTMRSKECQGILHLLRWWVLLVLSFRGTAAKKHYAINYGDGLGEANVELDEDTHTAYITPSDAIDPATLINFRKGLVVYVTSTECMVSKLQAKEQDYRQQLSHNINSTHGGQSLLYVTGVILPNKVRRFLGEELFQWCSRKPVLRLSKRRPKLPSNVFSLKPDLNSEVAGQLHKDVDEGMQEADHHRYKRRAKKERKSRERKGKSSKGRRGKGKKTKNKKGKKDKKDKKPKTKSLRSRAQQLNIKAPRLAFPLASIQHNLTADSTNAQDPSDHVVLQEEPYLSPSFIRNGKDGQRFRHYRDFYQDPNISNETRSPGHTNRIISHDPSSPVDGESKISIPETIVKDGQIFYRYDAEETPVDVKGQSKRSHTRDDDFMDDDAQPEEGFEYYNHSRGSLDDLSPSVSHQGFVASPEIYSGSEDRGLSQAEKILNTEHGSSHVQTQAQMGDGIRGASAGTGHSAQVQGNTNSEGYFIAQAQSMGHQGGGTSLAHVFGNQHSVLGSAMTSGNGHQSHVQVDMGAHPSSTAHIVSHGGSTSLSSSVHATQVGGRAGAKSYGDGASTSNAQMEFNPSHQYGGSNGGLRGQGAASATVTNSGSALLASLTGEVSGGSYLGTAHSNIKNDPVHLSSGENGTWSTHEEFDPSNGITHEFRQPDANLGGLTESSQFHDDLTHRRQVFDQTHHGSEHFREISSLTQDSSSHTDELVDPNTSRQSSKGQMIGNIMETVHQPNMQPEIIAYPVSQFDIIDDGGLGIGAGTPPRESEIEQAPISASEDIQEGIGISPGGSKAGIVGLATYSHGRLGAPPGPGELLNYPQRGSSQYDYDYYDNRYSSDYTEDEYDSLPPADHNNPPFFDLGPEIVGFEPIESNFENFQPMQLGLPGQPMAGPPLEHTGHPGSPLPNLHRYDELDSPDITPNPPIIVHQVQAPTLLPDDTLPDGSLASHSLSHESSSSNISSLYEEEELDSLVHASYPQASTETPLPSHMPTVRAPQYQSPTDTYIPVSHTHVSQEQRTTFMSTHSPSDAHTPVSFTPASPEQRTTFSSPHFPSDTQIPVSFTPVSPERRTTFNSSQSANETYSSTLHQDNFESQQSLQQTPQHPLPSQDSVALNMQPQIGTMMMGIPLYPGNPGSVRTLPGHQGGPDLNIMSVSASEAKGDRSLLYQRQGTSLQPGEKIPGAPGYSVPPGFRGHVILGDSLPVNAESRRVVEGFNTHVRLSPQNPSASNPFYASVSGPGASQRLISQDDPSGVHITLGRGGYQSPSRVANGRHVASSHQVPTHSAGRSQPLSGSTAMVSRDRQGSLPPRKSWDGRQHGMTTSQQSWGTTGGMQKMGNGDSCGYYSMDCKVTYGPNNRSQICKPILFTIACCC